MTLPAPLRRPELAPLWAEAHRRLSTGRPVSAIQVDMPTLDQRHAVADLLGLSLRPPSPYRVRMATLDAILVDAVGRDTRSVVSEILGPSTTRPPTAPRTAPPATRSGRGCAPTPSSRPSRPCTSGSVGSASSTARRTRPARYWDAPSTSSPPSPRPAALSPPSPRRSSTTRTRSTTTPASRRSCCAAWQ